VTKGEIYNHVASVAVTASPERRSQFIAQCRDQLAWWGLDEAQLQEFVDRIRIRLATEAARLAVQARDSLERNQDLGRVA
jgi:hypothetical protein